MLATIASVILLTSCSNQSSGSNESPAPKADRLAKQTFKAVVDEDLKTIYNQSAKDYQKDLRQEGYYSDPDFGGKTDEEIQQMKIYSPNSYKKLVDHGDYIFGAYYGFLEKNNAVLYYVNGYIDGVRKELRFEIKKVKGEWKIYRYDSWQTSLVHDQTEKYVNLIQKDEDENVRVFHRGENYQTGK